jgi:hypothetical protein
VLRGRFITRQNADHKGLRRELSRTIGTTIFAKNDKLAVRINKMKSYAIKIFC